jgi:hypothetical protein
VVLSLNLADEELVASYRRVDFETGKQQSGKMADRGRALAGNS